MQDGLPDTGTSSAAEPPAKRGKFPEVVAALVAEVFHNLLKVKESLCGVLVDNATRRRTEALAETTASVTRSYRKGGRGQFGGSVHAPCASTTKKVSNRVRW